MYEIKILSDKEFEALPYPELEMSLGVADPKTGTAYVRYTHSDELNKYLIEHELEHLIEGSGGEHSEHYRNGVYYKGFGNILQSVAPILSFIPGIGPIAGAAAGAGGTYMAGRDARKKAEGMAQGQANQSQGSPMAGFDGGGMESSMPTPTPNIVTPGSAGNSSATGGAGGGLGGELSGEGGSAVERVRGFFSGRNPIGGF